MHTLGLDHLLPVRTGLDLKALTRNQTIVVVASVIEVFQPIRLVREPGEDMCVGVEADVERGLGLIFGTRVFDRLEELGDSLVNGRAGVEAASSQLNGSIIKTGSRYILVL